jgi:RNA polymerase sigma factor (sigma-70 family)
MQKEMFADQVVRITQECAKKCGMPERYTDDCAMTFLHRKFVVSADLAGPTWKGEEERKLVAMAEMYVRGHLYQLRKRAKKEVSLTGPDGTESSGPAGQLVSRIPGPEEMALRKQIRELIDKALPGLTERQRELYHRIFEREERAVDLQEAMGCSAEAVRQARAHLRAHLHKLLVAAGLDDAAASAILNELERFRRNM